MKFILSCLHLLPLLVGATERELVIGGSNVPTNGAKVFPYYVYLYARQRGSFLGECSGVLITRTTVLTSGDCFAPDKASEVEVAAFIGATKRFNPFDTSSENALGLRRDVFTSARHPQYKKGAGNMPSENNIMVLRLLSPVPVTLEAGIPEINDDPGRPVAGTTAALVGLGISSLANNIVSYPNVLQRAQVQIENPAVCRNQFAGSSYAKLVSGNQNLCVRRTGGRGFCGGDAGAPLVSQRDGQPDLLYGIANTGVGCADPAQGSDLYIDIAANYGWIWKQASAFTPGQTFTTKRPTPAPVLAPSPSPTPAPFFVCFSGANTVEVHDKGTILMKDLRLGDQVKVADNSFQPVYSFGHYEQKQTGQYLHIKAENMQPLEISKDHLLLVSGRGYVPASSVVVGDSLVSGEASLMKVTSIRSKTSTGVFAPFTPSGTIVVNNIVASSYVTFQEDSGVVMIGGRSTGLTYQWLAQSCLLPGRLLGHYFGPFGVSDGIAGWVSVPHSFGVWWVNQHAVVMGLLLIPLLLIAGTFSLVELFGLCGMLAMMAVVVNARRFKMNVKAKCA